QLNAGAKAARASTLLFLHADTRLPAGWQPKVEAALDRPGPVVGAFSLAIEDAGMRLSLVALGANVRSRLLGRPYGDQALFMRRSTFAALGGFRALPIMEDLDFVRRAARIGHIVTLPDRVVTSARRWRRHGAAKSVAINQAMLVGEALGMPHERLAAFYRRAR
ncbi:MAG: glycosyltransferase family 2 protein, partial [Pseudomonadota bacterium]